MYIACLVAKHGRNVCVQYDDSAVGGTFYETTRRHIRKGRCLDAYRLENLKIPLLTLNAACLVLVCRTGRRTQTGCSRTFGSIREEVRGHWRKFRDEELHDSYSSECYGDEIRQDEVGGWCSLRGKDKKCMPNFGGETRRIETGWKTDA
jgi:hypothetical protein